MASSKKRKKTGQPKKQTQKRRPKFLRTWVGLALLWGAIAGVLLSFYHYLYLNQFADFGYLLSLFAVDFALGIAAALLLAIVVQALFFPRLKKGKRKSRWPYNLIVAILVAMVAYGYNHWNANRGFNVILIVSDATRADHLSCYGYKLETTPNIDQFAREGIRFENPVAQGSHTIVATPAILASVYPTIHGLTHYQAALSDSITLISELMKKAGYQTLGISTNPHVTEANGFAQGFDYYESDRGWQNTDAEVVNQKFLRFLNQYQSGKFLAFLFYIDPHTPYDPPKAYLRKFGADLSVNITDWGQDNLLPIGEHERRDIVARYDGEINYFDNEFGNLMQELKKRGLYDRSLIVYTSDHGEGFWDHDLVGHGNSLYEELLRVPLIMRFPVLVKFPKLQLGGKVLTQPARQIDIVPTTLDLLGIKAEGLIFGTSLLPLISGKRESLQELEYVISEEILQQPELHNIRSIRSGAWKYIITQDFEKNEFKRELYNLSENPAETVNLCEQQSPLAVQLEQRLFTELSNLERLKTTPRVYVPDKQVLEKLKALGYIK
ncbi:MAG: sulfatase [Candidatus Zixiibacteriota bacterium]